MARFRLLLKSQKFTFYCKIYITEECNGIFPSKYEDILNLKGVGEYTAAAISSFSFDQSYPVIDGNVYRVLSRIYGVEDPIDTTNGKKVFKQLAGELIDDKNPAIYNQAIMEFGALQCTPKKPDCQNCPFRLECFALKNDMTLELPKKEKKLKQRNRYFNYLVLIDDEKTFLNKRTDKDIWQGLYDFPLIETKEPILVFEHIKKEFKNSNLTLQSKSIEFKHILSHQKIYATFWNVSCNNQKEMKANYTEIILKNIDNYPVPKLIENYLKTIL